LCSPFFLHARRHGEFHNGRKVRHPTQFCFSLSISRYAYTDYTFRSVLQRAMREGISRVGLHYDIVCHYLVNFWGRMSQLQSPLQPITHESFDSFVAAIPKFHLAGHTDNCYARFSLNFLPGVGRLDGEGGERCCQSPMRRNQDKDLKAMSRPL
jgi:hypothetical protein